MVVALAMIPALAIYIYAEPSVTLWLSLKPLLVGILMFGYVYTYNMSKVTKGLRQPREINQEEKKALEMLANIRDLDHDKAESLLERLTPEMRQRIVGLATERLRKEERELLAWDLVCVELTKSEKVICKLILEGKTLKEICSLLNKSEFNITSQRCHIRRKLKMGRKDDLRRTYLYYFYVNRSLMLMNCLLIFHSQEGFRQIVYEISCDEALLAQIFYS